MPSQYAGVHVIGGPPYVCSFCERDRLSSRVAELEAENERMRPVYEAALLVLAASGGGDNIQFRHGLGNDMYGAVEAFDALIAAAKQAITTAGEGWE